MLTVVIRAAARSATGGIPQRGAWKTACTSTRRTFSSVKSSEGATHKQTLPERFSMKGKVRILQPIYGEIVCLKNTPQTCVVTGAAQGLGYEFCRALVET